MKRIQTKSSNHLYNLNKC